jgi:hypothetical protein
MFYFTGLMRMQILARRMLLPQEKILKTLACSILTGISATRNIPRLLQHCEVAQNFTNQRWFVTENGV